MKEGKFLTAGIKTEILFLAMEMGFNVQVIFGTG